MTACVVVRRRMAAQGKAGQRCNAPGHGRTNGGFDMASVRGAKPCVAGCTCGRHRKKPVSADCAQCGESFIRRVRRKGKPQRFCSLACRDASYRTGTKPIRTECLACGASVPPFPRRKFCSLACRDASYRRAPHMATCVQCGVEFHDRWHAASRPRQFCSMACHQASQRVPDKLHRNKQLKLVRREPYTRAEIAERDGWRCQLCGKRVPRDAKHPDPLSLSIDHVVPISEGGDDAPANVQLAHLRCNLSKGTRALPQGEQLRLIG